MCYLLKYNSRNILLKVLFFSIVSGCHVSNEKSNQFQDELRKINEDYLARIDYYKESNSKLLALNRQNKDSVLLQSIHRITQEQIKKIKEVRHELFSAILFNNDPTIRFKFYPGPSVNMHVSEFDEYFDYPLYMIDDIDKTKETTQFFMKRNVDGQMSKAQYLKHILHEFVRKQRNLLGYDCSLGFQTIDVRDKYNAITKKIVVWENENFENKSLGYVTGYLNQLVSDLLFVENNALNCIISNQTISRPDC